MLIKMNLLTKLSCSNVAPSGADSKKEYENRRTPAVAAVAVMAILPVSPTSVSQLIMFSHISPSGTYM